MASNLAGFGIPFILDVPKSREEKIEEARRSGLIGDRGPKDLAGALQGQQMCCKKCGSRNVQLLSFDVTDLEKGCEILYYCNNCGYEGTRAAKVRTVKEDQTVVVDLVPDGLVMILLGLELKIFRFQLMSFLMQLVIPFIIMGMVLKKCLLI